MFFGVSVVSVTDTIMHDDWLCHEQKEMQDVGISNAQMSAQLANMSAENQVGSQ